MNDFKFMNNESNLREESVAIIRLFRKTTLIASDNYVKIDRSALDCPSLDLIEKFVLDGLNSLISKVYEYEKISVSPQFYINQQPDGEADLFTSIVLKGNECQKGVVEKLKGSVSLLIENIVGNGDIFNDSGITILGDAETAHLKKHAMEFLARNGCRRLTDSLCVHVGFDDPVGIQVSDRLAPSDAIVSNNDIELEGVAFVDGYILSKNIIYLVDADGRQGASKPFICDHPEIIQQVRKSPFCSTVRYTGYQRTVGVNRSAFHVKSIELSCEAQSVKEFCLSPS